MKISNHMSKNTVYSKTSKKPALPGRVTKQAAKARRAPKLGPKELLCPDGCAWLDQLTTLFDRKDSTLVGMPLAVNQFGCPSNVTYGYADTTVTATNQNIHIWGFPGGIQDGLNPSDEPGEVGHVSFSGGFSQVGTTNGTLAGFRGTMCAYQQSASDDPSQVCASGSATAIRFPYNTIPTHSGLPASAAPTGYQARTAAFAIRVSFIGPLSDTEGYVDFVMPSEYGEAGPVGAAPSMGMYRTDPSFRRHFFGVERTFEFFWTPNCDELRYMEEYGDTKHAAVNLWSRFFLNVGGLATNDKIMIEVATVQEVVVPRANATAAPRPVSVDSQHIVNALQLHHGAHNAPSDAKTRRLARPMDLVRVTAGHKVKATPALSYLSSGVQFVSKNWNEIEKLGTLGAKAVGRLAAAII